MSHFTRVRTRLTDEPTIKQALARMSYKVLDAADGVRGWQGQRTKAAFKVRVPRTSYEIGFVPGSSTAQGFSIVADWWGIRVMTQDEFTQRLTREYAYVATVNSLAAKGFQIQEQTTQESGEVRLVLRRTVAV